MNKQELGDKIAEKFDLSKNKGEEIMKFILKTIIEELQAGHEVVLTGFGTYSAKNRSARGGVNPQNPTERIQIPAVVVPKFKSGKALKDALKQK